MPLTNIACKNAKPGPTVRKLSDGGGLQLCVNPNGSKVWRIAYRFGGKQKSLSLGPYPLVALADARKARDDAKRHLVNGEDPSEIKKQRQAAQAADTETFHAIAAEYVKKLRREGRAATMIAKIEWLLSFSRMRLHRP